ncbi:TraR/DksA family transcriptional regulator [Noviherbaspirillum aridicola]|uniref:Zinc finger DksA/TraR C4-type domain-containing protein n=1 Tax=Noviherbaspirillum aridicola TaxID=2849687 RepID=A0ABQ4PZ43_9BURK|nr:TraR/DksA C4-type zinc finger protein [Noviherbaspirillum aridicola]GIZ50124.1 hypothetical protein NCCP691_01380 [Noviherbaspirillum aridicola]
MNPDKAKAMLQARRREVIDDLRRRLHAEGESEQLALVNHLEDAGDWAEASSENLNDLALLQHEVHTLRQLDEALQRVGSGQFGLCRECGDAIPDGRLEVQPEAATCIDCQQALERQERRA